LLFDSKPTEKRKIDETYKQNRGDVYDSLAGDVDDIVWLARVFPNVHVVQHEGFESDDIAYNLCRTLERPIVWSDDIDWIVNFTVNPNVTWIRNKKLYTRMNFTGSFGFSFEKIPLYLFLLGDSKDSVSKPFRLKGPIEESVLHHADIADYLKKNNLTREEVSHYCDLLFPLKMKTLKTQEGIKTADSVKLAKQFRCDHFYKTLLKERKMI